MASPAARADLSLMYGFRRTTTKVRDTAPRYGTQPRDDRYPADDVLADLPTATDDLAIARILARYAALRHWLLRVGGAPRALTDHAAEAARSHLDAAGGPEGEPIATEWAEGETLRRLGEAPLHEAGGLLAGAAREAARVGDRCGAGALDAAARDALRSPPPS